MSSIPSFVAAGVHAHGTGSLSVAMPAGIVEDDYLVLIAESENQDIATPTTGGTWTQISVAQGSGVAGTDTSIRLEAWGRFAGPSEGNVTVNDSGDHTAAQILAFRGVDRTTPVNVAAGSTAASGTAVTFDAVTTTVANCLVVNVIAGSQDTTTAQASGWTNASLASPAMAELTGADSATTDAGGGTLSVGAGGKAVAGSSGATTATMANSTLQGKITFALAPLTAFRIIAGSGSYGITGTAANLLYTDARTVIESFETGPLAGDMTWTAYNGAETITSSTSHVTQGAKTWRIQGGPADGGIGVGVQITGVDLTGVDEVKLDIFVQSFPLSSTAYVELYVETPDTDGFEDSPNLATGARTLTADISGSSNKTNCNIFIASFYDGDGVDFYIDNLGILPPVGGGGGVTLTADAGSYALTGTAANLERNSEVAANGGTYALTGVSATLAKGFALASNAGAYIQTGNDVNFIRGFVLVGVSGSYAITGQDGSLQYDTIFPVAAGSYAITGQAALTGHNRFIDSDDGSYAISGQAVEFLEDYNLSGQAGSYAITGADAGSIYHHLIAGGAGLYTLAGQEVGLARDTFIDADEGSYAISGNNIDFDLSYFIEGVGGAYSLSGQDTAFRRSYVLRANSGRYGGGATAYAFA